jgi:hypothetical protein
LLIADRDPRSVDDEPMGDRFSLERLAGLSNSNEERCDA